MILGPNTDQYARFHRTPNKLSPRTTPTPLAIGTANATPTEYAPTSFVASRFLLESRRDVSLGHMIFAENYPI